MSVDTHRSAETGPVRVHVVVVSSTRTAATDTAGARIIALLGSHTTTGPEIVEDGVATVQQAIRSADADVVILTGGTGLSASDVTAEAAEALFTRKIPGFGELFRVLSFQEIGAAAWLSRATAGLVGNTLVFALPGSEKGAALAVERLIAPELGHALHQIRKEGTQPVDLPEPEAEAEVEVEDEEDDDEPKLPPPSGVFGVLGGGGLSMKAGDVPERDTRQSNSGGPVEEIPGLPAAGWQRAIYEIKGTLTQESREELPQPIENLAPLIDVLHTAGQTAVLKLENGRRYSVWGFPDLNRSSSKVLAVGWGDPFCELLALHRHPSMTGVCIREDFGLLPKRASSVEEVCEAVTGAAPRDTSGTVFAVQGDTVWIERGKDVYKWDGRRETNDGRPKQVLASLALRWSQR